jgi:Tfp pilus assembly protein PilF
MLRRLVTISALAALGACSTEPGRAIQGFFSPSKGQSALEAGVQQYQDGDYADSAKSISTALGQGLNDGEQVRAHKYLAFINCAANRIGVCRDEFRKALAIDPSFELSAAEAGHPTWGPIFRQLKSR